MSADQIVFAAPLFKIFFLETRTKVVDKVNNYEDGKETAKKIMSNAHPTPSTILRSKPHRSLTFKFYHSATSLIAIADASTSPFSLVSPSLLNM